MKLALRQIRRRQWLALSLSVSLGAALVALLFAGLRPAMVAAAGQADPSVAYPCTPAGLDSALAAGGSATFSCGAVTTVTVSARKTVSHNVSLDGGNQLIVSGGGLTGVFTVPSGVHLSLLNLELFNGKNNDDYGGDIHNNGVLSVTNSTFISNTAVGGAAVYNAPGASAVISGSQFGFNVAEGGAILNGDNHVSATASLSLVNTIFYLNEASGGAGVYNLNGPVAVTGGGFEFNLANTGGAIYNLSHLTVQSSQLIENGAFLSAPLSRPPALQQPAGFGLLGGGAIFVAPGGDALVSSSFFTTNYGESAGGAILYGTLPFDSNVTPTPGGLTLVGDQFFQNCTAGAGGALSSSQVTTVTDSSFIENGASSDGCGFLDQQVQARFHSSAPSRPALVLSTNLIGPGGAIFSDGTLLVAGSTFLSNTASVTSTGGGGAIDNFDGSQLTVHDSTFTANTAWQDGGAIYNDVLAAAAVANSNFSQNSVLTDTGGAIANQGALTVTLGSFTANHGGPGHGGLKRGGGAIYSGLAPLGPLGPSGSNGSGNGGRAAPTNPSGALSSSLHVDHVTFTSNTSEFEGGAIDAAPATVVDSTFLSNTAAFGGAIDILNNGFIISGSTFIGNAVVTTTLTTASQGGAIDTYGAATNINIVNSTFYANHAPAGAQGGAINGDGNAYAITNSTFLSNTAVDVGRGGALSGNQHFLVHNTLIAFNSGGNCRSTMTLNGANLEFPGTTCGGATVQADPKAQAPANNGGPTLTSALLLGSPAIDAGDNAGCPTTDQRGAPRPVGANCDLGAFEFGGLVPRLWLALTKK